MVDNGCGNHLKNRFVKLMYDSTSYLDRLLNSIFPTEPTTSYGEMMPAGHHALAFDIQVPKHLPGSFEGRHGFLRHWLECVVDRPGAPELNAKLALSVISVCDLNKDPVASVSLI